MISSKYSAVLTNGVCRECHKSGGFIAFNRHIISRQTKRLRPAAGWLLTMNQEREASTLQKMTGPRVLNTEGCRPFNPIRFSSGSSSSSVRVDEVDKFEKMSASWWDNSTGFMKELHSMNKLRVPFIRDGILSQTKQQLSEVPNPLEGIHILDVGCGGGILSEPLGRLGANVKGIDPGRENIIVACNHLSEGLRERVSYDCISIEELALLGGEREKYDAVVMSEVIEHIENPENFIRTATELLKPNGSLFLTTLNRTLESWLGAIIAWEHVLRKLPVGTHDWNKFLTPQEMDRIFKSCSLRTVALHGMCYNPLNNTWKWSDQRAINYAMHAVKI